MENKEFEDMSNCLDEIYAEIEKLEKDVYNHNQSVLEEIEITFNFDSIKEDFIELIDFVDVTNKIEIVNKPNGQEQHEKCGVFTKIFVDQWSVGNTGDSYGGHIYGKFAKNKWLKIPYSC